MTNEQSDMLAALEAALGDVAEAFAEAPADSGSIYQPPPDGEYEALVHQFEFLAGDWGVGLKVNYQITNHAQYGGKIVGDMFGIRPDRIQWLKSFLSRLDVDVENVNVAEDLRPGSQMLTNLLDTPVLVKVQRKILNEGTVRQKNVVNVYLQRKLGEPGSTSTGFTPAPQSDLGNNQAGFDFAPQPAGSRYGHSAVDDDIPF